MSAAVEIFTRPSCGYCSAAKSLLTRKNMHFKEFDVSLDPSLRETMIERSNGGTTFPQIFISGVHVGGCDELYALDREGKLDDMLAGQRTEQKATS